MVTGSSIFSPAANADGRRGQGQQHVALLETNLLEVARDQRLATCCAFL